MKKEFVKEITSRDEDFAKWYTDIVKKADLVDYSPVKGFMVIKPYGYALWENIQKFVDERLKETGHQNMYFPLLIPESLLNKEKEHVEGFAPEVAWVTHGGENELGEKLCIRPTSETIICNMYSKWLKSYRELPYLYNQWCSVVRWEKTTRPFLRTSEFLWQEGHTLHITEEEARKETLDILDLYILMAKEMLSIPMIHGIKSEKEKFAGADETYTIEALMHDGKALQSGTSHFLGRNFTTAFDIKYLNKNGRWDNPYHTSWGISTRLIGGLIMVHGDDRGLVLPPNIAPLQVAIIPIKNKEEVLKKANEIYAELKKLGIRVKLDDSTNYSPGWKFNEYEMKGVPIRIELGPRDVENNQVVIARRDNFSKETYKFEEAVDIVKELIKTIGVDMYNKALKRREELTFEVSDYEEFKNKISQTNGFYKACWCGNEECELKIKDDTKATIRCIVDEKPVSDKCLVCKKEADKSVYIAKAY